MRVVKISKPNCVPCENVTRYLKERNIPYIEYNIKEDPSLIEKYSLTGVPVILLYNEGKMVQRIEGYNPIEMDEMIRQLLE